MSDLNQTILIFPGGMPRSLDYLQESVREGRSVVGASSLGYDPSRERYPAWVQLPFITQPEFDTAFRQAISDFKISGVYTPNPVIWNYLKRMLKTLALGVSLVNDAPFDGEMHAYRLVCGEARAQIENPLPLGLADKPNRQLSEIELAALFHHAELIPGMCDREKRSALCEIARYVPQGDVVEIGSWWGKSAFILARLAHCHGIGNLLCVDPWSNDHLVQKDEGSLVDAASAQVDAEEALTVFSINLLPYSAQHINYLRMPSVAGAQHYRSTPDVATSTFGNTTYSGHIALLHIDGNHHYDSVKADIAAWCDLVIAGGWIIVDDYIWPYGDGPKKAGDEFLSENFDRIDIALVMGGALFLRLVARCG